MKDTECSYDYISSQISDSLNSKLDGYIIEGLKRKGFEFENKADLHKFITEKCRCEDLQGVQERVYFIDDKPFFMHRYNTNLDIETIVEDRKTTVSGNYGSYAYL